MPQTTSFKNSEIKFTLSTKGKHILIYEGYRYILNQKKIGKKYWRREDGSACRAYVHTTSDDIYIKHNDKQHNHFPDPDEILITEITEKFAIELLTNIYLLVWSTKICFYFIESALYLARSSTIPIIPKTYGFCISSLYRFNGNEENFLLADRDSTYLDRILMFSSNRQLEFFLKSEVIFCDGTFASAPPQFEQIYTMHAVYEDEVFPCVFALCTHKNTQIYITIMEALKSAAERMNKQFAPSLIMSDFEGGFREAVNQTVSSVR
ncbi:unnamed protein product [Rotaria socialis]|uniref:MULE transposase domain-containing protein n=1 Tax=Rotaria socialis TaxID=392032 RepID=A0A821VKC3_9BILA|nr:unnamed protein product [Rotaria socialis]